MSINGAMLAGVSGLTANAAALSTISQNIANVNTVGYKRAATEFSTVVNAQTQGVGYSAGGVQATARHFISQAGQLQRTTSGTDLAIAGQGFFVVTEKSENLAPSDTRLFTRAGAFKIDDLGYLQNTSGLYLQGWPVAADGTVNVDPSDMTRLRTINVGSVGGAAEPTTRVGLNANLKSSQRPSEAAEQAALAPPGLLAYDPTSATRSMASYDPAAPNQGTRADFQISVPVSDSKGGARMMTISFLKKADEPNTWFAEIHAPDGSVENADLPLKSGLVKFLPDGRLDTGFAGPNALFPDTTKATITLAASGAAPGPDDNGVWSGSEGLAAQTITFDLAASTGGLTQYDSTSIVQATYTNGTAFGNLTEVKIDEAGFVTAIFDNGVMRKIAQVALATFPSADSLTEVAGNAFRVSQNSGTFNLKAPGTGGAGLLGAQQLEASTVDLSTEFTGLITTQRAYSASSKIITTADEMLAELINIKR
ncbi:flagellar hook protein FlgE [Brevundimonas guildfordensis]|uniref:Flagellar hook protein FlgE n=1 Tax=Brevundimonas guildfordensis TaxID=2762241 RepID=A0ABR8QZH3_9CAUL|nr:MULTISPECIES: flagellar hook protein FlgE [Brevundimonas]MBD7940928.1 flagellar hook protein FlgE [Brevundimonas guildfordensis]